MAKLNLSIAVRDYDRTRPLSDGIVQIDGVDAVFMALDPEEIFFRAFRHAEFDICELSMSSFTVKTALGNCPYVGVPAFVSRAFRHTAIYVRTDRIKKPADLKGKRIGVPEYQLTANVWARAILEDDHGVKPSDVHWIRAGLEEVGRPEKIAITLPKDVRLDPKDDSPPACKGFQGAWSGRWDGLRTVELWIEKIDRDCKAQVVYGRGGQSVNMEEPKYQRTSGKVSGNEMRIQLDDGAVIMLKQAADDRLSANWTREGRSAKCEMHRIGDDPAAATAVFAQEATDFGARPTRYLELPSPDKPLPMSVPGVSTITTLELKDLLEKNPNAVLIDAYHDNEHMTLPGAIWRPDIGDLRPGAFPLSDIKKLMAEATGNDLDRPIVVFERSSNWGWYGYNASLRLLGLGYTNVYWYRGGLDAWFDAGFQMAKVNNRKVVTQ